MSVADPATSIVSTDWAREHLDDAGVRFLEVDVEIGLSIETGEGSAN